MPPNMTTPRGTQDDDDSVVCFLYLIFLGTMTMRSGHHHQLCDEGGAETTGSRDASAFQAPRYFFSFFLLDYAMCMEWGTATILGAQ